MEKKYCMQCGKEVAVNARFCADCGATLGAKPPTAPVDLGLSDSGMIFLIYLVPLLGAGVALYFPPYNRKPNLRFHSFQSLFFIGAWFALHLAVILVTLPLTLVGLPLVGFLSPIVHFALMAAWVYLIVQALMGKTVRLPVIADLADQQATKMPPPL